MGTYMGQLWVSGLINLLYGLPAQDQVTWNGQQWQAVPDGRYAADHHVHNGELYIAGYWSGPWTVPPANRRAGVLRWTGTGWATVGTNFPDSCEACTTFRGQLVCGGWFDSPIPGNNIGAWNGQTWLPLGQGVQGSIWYLKVFDPDGPGPLPEMLFAGGSFISAGGQPASGIAAWDGQSWHPIMPGVNGRVEALEVMGGQLYLGGRFTFAGGVPANFIARWGCPQPPPPPTCYPNCDGSMTPPILNVDDFTCFINQFSAASALQHIQQLHHYANCDNSTTAPVLNVDDFTCFINRFAAGCP
jgi:trimeric autotransporter adhesin